MNFMNHLITQHSYSIPPFTPKVKQKTIQHTNPHRPRRTRSLTSAPKRARLAAIDLIFSVTSALHKIQAVTVIFFMKSCTLSSNVQHYRAAPRRVFLTLISDMNQKRSDRYCGDFG